MLSCLLLAVCFFCVKAENDGSDTYGNKTVTELCLSYNENQAVRYGKKVGDCEILCSVQREVPDYYWLDKRYIDDDDSDDFYPYRSEEIYPPPWHRNLPKIENITTSLRNLEPCGTNKVCQKGSCVNTLNDYQDMCDTTNPGSMAVQPLPPTLSPCQVLCIKPTDGNWPTSDVVKLTYKYPCGTDMGCYDGYCMELSKFPSRV